MTTRSWTFVFRRIFRAFLADGCADIAASLAFYAILALLPATMVGFSILSVLGRDDETAQILMDVVRAVAPEEAAAGLGDFLGELSELRMSGLLLVFGLLLSIWSVARYVGVLGRGMNRIYGVEEGRRIWTLKPIQLVIALVTIVCAVIAVLFIVGSGPVAHAVGNALGLGETVLFVWRIARWPLLVVLVVFVIAFLYYFSPNIRPPRFRLISLGAAVALAVLAVASAGFGLYIANFANYERVYGSFAGVIVFALWMWIANMALLVGVQFDTELERVRELRRGVPAETQVQLPLRDASRIAAVVRNDRADTAKARRIRAERAADDQRP
ncbi:MULTISPECIES: YihY/virulence factor BrkB family protein [Microbacterium]|uniref:YihY/virulence factor BrkB family protein n=1 Tax=Microbacterium profundi TaxID=450380 RepID=A0ABV3LGB1_9MICO|nr:YihY/virulence factor BrkB family protein [Microbacterium profundi]MCE7482992.1 YihY/virulence factor BrkB family protein [Microbacterium profundi]